MNYVRRLSSTSCWAKNMVNFENIPYSFRKLMSDQKSKFLFLKLYELLMFRKINRENQNQIYKILSSLDAKNSENFMNY